MLLSIFLLLLTAFRDVKSQGVKLLIVSDHEGHSWNDVNNSFFNHTLVTIERGASNSSQTELCEILSGGVWGIVDLTWSGLDDIKTLSEEWGLPYIRWEGEFTGYLRAAEKSLRALRNAPDAALIFQNENQLEESLYYLVRESSLRVILFNGLVPEEIETLKTMRPTPEYNIIFADAGSMPSLFSKAVDNKLVRHDYRWMLVFLGDETSNIEAANFVKRTVLMQRINKSNYPDNVAQSVAETIQEATTTSGFDLAPVKVECGELSSSSKDLAVFQEQFLKAVESKPWLDFQQDTRSISLHVEMEMASVNSQGERMLHGTWNSRTGFTSMDNVTSVRRFFRIATGYMVPFAYPAVDSTGKVKLDEEGNQIWEGYCIDLINELARIMDFEYELTTSYDFGRKLPNGSWTGLIGELSTGKVDIVVAALTMTAEREEVIDFVSPYFEQSGFAIVIRKPLRKTSLFKFMTVLRVEVWFSILAALCLTAVMIWLLDKYSPYSARNNKEKYPYPTRDFSLRESFWFAVTSFTPQGGGEAPKSLSARTLVAAYWLFVVLMLATFTANLAAFLTVERMQSPVQSLNQLARQSRINYTVVQDSDAHNYFRNMKFAEETLYRVWKEITLNATANQSQYRVWDYPIKEQYGHILIAMEKTGTVPTGEEGFRKVNENEDAEFALIHDALEIKYHVYSNCNLTEIGEPFAEQPYSIAVQQGSHLNEEISRRVLDLQKFRFFEKLTGKYWNATVKANCDSYDEDEGITLESLGGVFIATLFGLALAMITLGVEIVYEKKSKKKGKNVIQVKKEKSEKNDSFINDKIFSREFGQSLPKTQSSLLNPPNEVSFIKMFPRGQLY